MDKPNEARQSPAWLDKGTRDLIETYRLIKQDRDEENEPSKADKRRES